MLHELRHPNLIEYDRAYLKDDVMHIAMEYADGGTLQNVRDCRGVREPRALGVAAAHARRRRR